MSCLSLLLRPLRLDDLPALMVIEEQVFPVPWPESTYCNELTRASHGHYYALVLAESVQTRGQKETASSDRDDRPDSSGQARVDHLLGYGGFWLLGDEAHLMTLAVAPEWQGHGLGEWLLLKMLDVMEVEGASLATLEVRAGNRRAQSLYQRLGFQIKGRRRGYYNDNQEDAIIMTTPPLASAPMIELRRRRQGRVRERLRRWLASIRD